MEFDSAFWCPVAKAPQYTQQVPGHSREQNSEGRKQRKRRKEKRGEGDQEESWNSFKNRGLLCCQLPHREHGETEAWFQRAYVICPRSRERKRKVLVRVGMGQGPSGTTSFTGQAQVS